jgi:HEPN domain-containing protein
MTYVSPFNTPDSSHDSGLDPLCMSRAHSVDIIDTLAEFRLAAEAAIRDRASLPAFFLARQLAELSLKALYDDYRETKLKNTHNLTALLDALAVRYDELLDGDPERAHIVAFIRDLQSHDGRGDQGRYPEASDGTPSLSTVCCAEPELLAQEIERMYLYVARRIRSAQLAG